jgi:hypothetical protein
MDSRRNPSPGIKRSSISIIPELLHHAGFGTQGNGAIQPTGSAFMSSTLHAHDLIQCQQRMNVRSQISDSAYHTGSLFHARPFATKPDSTSTRNLRDPGISNQALHLTAFRAGCCRSGDLARRSVTAVAYASAAPSLSRFSIHACFPEGCR